MPKYDKIQRALRKQIQDGALKAGSQLPPQNDLAKKFGASLLTLRQALGILEKEGLIARIHGRGTFVCPLKIPQQSANNKNVIVHAKIASSPRPNRYQEIELEILDNILSEQGRHLAIAVLTAQDVARGTLHPALRASNVRGVLLEHFVEDVYVEFLRSKGFPTVVMGTYPLTLNTANVAFDDKEAMYLISRAMLKHYPDLPLFFLTEPFHLHYSHALDEGYRRACEETGQRPRTRLVRDQVNEPELEIKRILEENPSPFGLIVHANIAHGLIKLYEERRLDLEKYPVAIYGSADYVSPSVRNELNHCTRDISIACKAALQLLEKTIESGSIEKWLIRPELKSEMTHGRLSLTLDWHPPQKQEGAPADYD
ncbi:MAG: GntR family transcriptional regulator [Verrucomicrobiota bacterium JB024]|nr:GntR family transcriptional regulator [Verrucomicrobiota bacterium JB024]